MSEENQKKLCITCASFYPKELFFNRTKRKECNRCQNCRERIAKNQLAYLLKHKDDEKEKKPRQKAPKIFCEICSQTMFLSNYEEHIKGIKHKVLSHKQNTTSVPLEQNIEKELIQN